jgi:lipopolysaccharide transport system ATP-binding protein
MQIAIEWEGATTATDIYSSFRIDSERLQAVTGFDAHEFDMFINQGQALSGRGQIVYTIPHLDLGEGKYFVSVSICKHMLPKGKEAILHYVEKAATFAVRRRVAWHLSYVYEPQVQARFEDQR